MNRCPITYELCEGNYSLKGLAKLSPRLKGLADLPFSAEEQRHEAALRADKMSVPGVQPKLSAVLSVKNGAFDIVDVNGNFIIKPQSRIYFEAPENEDLTMKMAAAFGIEVPLTGLIYSKDGSFSYFIKRFDRYSGNKKRQLEDFAQLTGNTRETKYDWSMEKLIPVIDNNCTFPVLEKSKLLRRTLFCFLTGNEHMHLKNFSLIARNNKIELSPAYDMINTTIALGKAEEELALPLAGKKSILKKEHFFKYFGRDRLQLTEKTLQSEYQNIINKKPAMENLVSISFMSADMKKKYNELLSERYERLV